MTWHKIRRFLKQKPKDGVLHFIVWTFLTHQLFVCLILFLALMLSHPLYSSGSQPRRNYSPGRNFMSSGRNIYFMVKVPIHCNSFFNWHWLFQLVISLHICKSFSTLSHVFVDKFNAIICQRKNFVPRLSIKLLWSIRTIVPTVGNS